MVTITKMRVLLVRDQNTQKCVPIGKTTRIICSLITKTTHVETVVLMSRVEGK